MSSDITTEQQNSSLICYYVRATGSVQYQHEQYTSSLSTVEMDILIFLQYFIVETLVYSVYIVMPFYCWVN